MIWAATVNAEPAEKISAFQGRHFIISFMQNEIDRIGIAQTTTLMIFVSSASNDTITIDIPQQPTIKRIIKPDEIIEIQIPDYCEIRKAGISNDKVVTVKSNTPITCWAYSSKNQSSDSYIAMPVGRWGSEYRIISMPNDLYNGRKRQLADGAVDSNGIVISDTKYKENMTPRSGEFLVMSNYDNTMLTYTPAANTRNGVRQGETASVLLNAGDILLVQAEEGELGTEDLTGTLVRSSNPVGVLSGHIRTAVVQGLDEPYDTKDHLVEMLPSTDTWGQRFFSVPFVDGTAPSYNLCASGDMIRVIAKEDNTTLKYYVHKSEGAFEEHSHNFKKAGDVFEVNNASASIYWEANKPIMVCQMMMHRGIITAEYREGLQYDPALVILSPLEQYIESVTFSTPRNHKIFSQYDAHCVIAIADSIAINNLFLDDISLNAGNTAVWKKRIGSSPYYWLMIDVKHGNHRLWARVGVFSGIIYGHGHRDSYAMTLGSRLNEPGKIDSLPPVISVKDDCGNIHIHISDSKKQNANASGIDWGFVTKSTYNFKVQPFEITDTSTVIDIYAEPVDRYADGVLEVEFHDKSYNKILKKIHYYGFKVDCPSAYNFNKVNWISATTAKITMKNRSNTQRTLLSITPSGDSRLVVAASKALPYTLGIGEEIEITLTFTPNGTTQPFNDRIAFNFDCNFVLTTDVSAEISAPGLIPQDLDFGKVRIGDSKTLSGKIINAGNININISSLEYVNDESCFSRQYSASFPTDLNIDDSITYTFDFSPEENRAYQTQVKAVNDADLACTFSVKGVGGSPNIEDLIIDFGKRRIGTSLDTTIYLVNSGSFSDTVSFKNEVSATHANEPSFIIFKSIKDQFIDEQDSIAIELYYAPEDTNMLHDEAEFSSQWKMHRPVYGIIKGQGTIPVIKTFDYDFGTVPMYSVQQADAEIIFSAGNEALTIDSIVPLSGDIASFEIDYAALKTLIIKKNSFFASPIEFKPNRSGQHRMVLAITHDANPAYIRSVDTVVITGYASPDNEDYVFALHLSQLYACNTTDAKLLIINNSDGKMLIDSISLSRDPDVFEAEFVDNIAALLPITVEPHSELELPVKVYAERNKNGKLHVYVHYNGEITRQLEADVNPIASTINTNIVQSKIEVAPGDTTNLVFKGIFEEKSEKGLKFQINLQIDAQIFYLLEKITYIRFFTNDKEITLQANLAQYDRNIEITIPDTAINIDEKTTLEFEIKLLVLLNSQTKTNIKYELISDRCYNPGITDLEIDISKVCAHDIRQIVFDNFPYAFVKQNPVVENIDFVINLMQKDVVDIIVSDIQGDIIFAKKQIYLENGKHNFIFDISKLTNSEYFITVRSVQLNTTQKFIILK